jgi:hypothetical protein
MVICYANDSLWVWDLNQLENVHVNISDIGYCTCRPDLGMLSGFSTCYMKSQAGVQCPITTENVRVKVGDIGDSTS